VRGTMDVLIVCLTTIILCVYNAIHLNIPAPREKRRTQFLRKIKWILVAILSPEVVLNAAWIQLNEARALRKVLLLIHQKAVEARENHNDTPPKTAVSEINDVPSDTSSIEMERLDERIPAEPKAPVLPDKNIITLTYCFYAVMGGFGIRPSQHMIDGNHESFKSTFTASPSAVAAFAQDGLWWDVDPATIQDKSKADNLAKILVVLQLSWMCIQCIARSASGLPMTLLELHTFIHAICAGIAFGLWFKVGRAILPVRSSQTH
jgi:hypothetical protein